MKKLSFIPVLLVLATLNCKSQSVAKVPTYLFMDMHTFKPGAVTFHGVEEAHQKDVAKESAYGVHFMKYWVDEAKGKVYCLASAPDSAAIYYSHKAAHGLTPEKIWKVSPGQESAMKSKGNLFFDIHYLGAGKVTANDVAGAHVKDLAVQNKYKANFVDYWVDEKDGIVMCLVQAPDSAAVNNAHKEAHGLEADEVHWVKQGN